MTLSIAISAPSLSIKDKQTAVWVIQQENIQRAAQETPLPPLPSSTNAEIKASYESILVDYLGRYHLANMAKEAVANGPDKPEFRTAFSNATEAQRAAALIALTS